MPSGKICCRHDSTPPSREAQAHPVLPPSSHLHSIRAGQSSARPRPEPQRTRVGPGFTSCRETTTKEPKPPTAHCRLPATPAFYFNTTHTIIIKYKK
ncbi:hypothetical protein AVEN_226510-1 [Araneus ventricosus]|uniref:Uncharacterized protein n=1 Tax=Araneus ventricosus TaxID=182803 RepID=A0A4Y2N0G0_ARAVE|nr:hypothetical protein AVEN_226510-1 [Araneus ventricosus]